MKEILIIDSKMIQGNKHMKKTVLRLSEESPAIQDVFIWLYYDNDWALRVHTNGYVEVRKKYNSIINQQCVEEVETAVKDTRSIIKATNYRDFGIGSSISISISAWISVADAVIKCIE